MRVAEIKPIEPEPGNAGVGKRVFTVNLPFFGFFNNVHAPARRGCTNKKN